ncbi:RNA-binding domain-containing protein [Ralstonia solanacearum]|uniref:RNA-binding domain-containing protein n=1 Tax=Ralstonia solanacearum TaxID=305 RepID=UPI0018C25DCE|nr:RNA-binding domain-containing protein [Ralstonia solanacearum]
MTVALSRSNEASDVDFKSIFDPTSNRDWLELIKDIAAFANSGGGHIFVGVNDDGAPSGADVSNLLDVDPADIGNRLHKYFGQHFAGLELVQCEKAGHAVCAIQISGARVPIVFTRVGEIELSDGKKKTVFALGTVYFRHGAKSEPGTSDDLRQFLDRELELTRKSWLDGITKVVEAPTGSRFAVLPPEGSPTGPLGTLPMQLTSDRGAPAYYAVPLDETHPHRQKEVVREVNQRLASKRSINSHDIICIRRVYAIQKQIQYCYTQNFASPRYSQQFVDWIVGQYESNSAFFEETRAKFDKLKGR